MSVDAGERERQGSNSPDANIVLDGLIAQPPYLLGTATFGVGGSRSPASSGNVSLQADWNKSRERKRDSTVCGLDGLPRW